MTDKFWDEVVIPFQENSDFQFANPVTVSEHFIRAIAQAADIAEKAERVAAKLAKLEKHKKEIDKEYSDFKRAILARHYGEVTKTASPDIMAAFIRRKAEEENSEDDLENILADMDVVDTAIDELTVVLNKHRARMKFLDKTMEWAKQFLDYDKLLFRLEQNGRESK